MSRFFYSLLFYLITPGIATYLLRRARKQPEYRQHWRERWALYDHSTLALPAGARPIWLHAVSVGEMRAAMPLIRALHQQYPARPLLLTCMTPTGRATAQELYGDIAQIMYLPYDYPYAVRRFLKRYRPAIGLLLETELWPNLLAACRRQRVPVWLVNARLSAKSAAGYQHIRWLAAPAFGRLTGALAQAPADAERLIALGTGNVHVTGNLKFENVPDRAMVERGLHWRSLFGNRPVLLLASSREGEELLLGDALRAAGLPADTLWIVVPRHPQRFDEVASLLETADWRVARRSQWQETPLPADVQVLLGDSMGEMVAWSAATDVAIIGGSLLPFGSQSLIEACAVGTPVLLGPSTYNFSQAAAEALERGAALQGEDAAAVAQLAVPLLADPARRKAMGDAGQAFTAAHRGATVRVLSHLEVDG
ncbi:3-deoxy-D-manno-octulosonic acid transferase [Andreprevotia sp. IGB-42]|uniref:lipid IV(A) 3-deoxy-D-manno-octulosonic acid transferase n=1 Tax=Andreprevotia sp. IGB-42 TaxID=2497473 RepID=UPI00135C479E|nr:lipid IV(A) 3-deoxy-D-manno-octulosonic acid transferase [Andreprevotia sp. IGB-42]KAF0814802.1 3-deoxy-D-manno-octulosonic acid transferase [Andreprevotia sp. IGB-42]